MPSLATSVSFLEASSRSIRGSTSSHTTTPRTEQALRAKLALPTDRPIAVYTGKLYYPYEEVGQIVEAAANPTSAGTLFVLVGGREDHVRLWRDDVARRGIDNVVFTGFVPPGEVHEYQLAADALLLYYPSGIELNAYRSPGKLFAYMAAGVPIVSVDLPVLREVLGDPPAATLVPPDSPGELARAVQRVLNDRRGSARARACRPSTGHRVHVGRAGSSGFRVRRRALRPWVRVSTVRLLVITLEGHPSSRLRIGQYLPALRADGVDVELVEVPSPRIPVAMLARIRSALRSSDAVFVQTDRVHAAQRASQDVTARV